MLTKDALDQPSNQGKRVVFLAPTIGLVEQACPSALHLCPRQAALMPRADQPRMLQAAGCRLHVGSRAAPVWHICATCRRACKPCTAQLASQPNTGCW